MGDNRHNSLVACDVEDSLMDALDELKRLSDDGVDIRHDLGKLQLRICGLQGGVMKVGLEQLNGFYERALKHIGSTQTELLQAQEILDNLLEKGG